jgi:hypothetical protein
MNTPKPDSASAPEHRLVGRALIKLKKGDIVKTLYAGNMKVVKSSRDCVYLEYCFVNTGRKWDGIQSKHSSYKAFNSMGIIDISFSVTGHLPNAQDQPAGTSAS